MAKADVSSSRIAEDECIEFSSYTKTIKIAHRERNFKTGQRLLYKRKTRSKSPSKAALSSDEGHIEMLIQLIYCKRLQGKIKQGLDVPSTGT